MGRVFDGVVPGRTGCVPVTGVLPVTGWIPGVVVLLAGRVGVEAVLGRETVIAGTPPVVLPAAVATAFGAGCGATMPFATGWALGTLNEATRA